jgi:hypothetical protein
LQEGPLTGQVPGRGGSQKALSLGVQKSGGDRLEDGLACKAIVIAFFRDKGCSFESEEAGVEIPNRCLLLLLLLLVIFFAKTMLEIPNKRRS